MKKKTIIILGVIILGVIILLTTIAFFDYYTKQNLPSIKMKKSETYTADTMNLKDVDIVFYSYNIQHNKPMINAYVLKEDEFSSINKNEVFGYSSTVDMAAIEPIMKKLSVNTYADPENDLGQYCFYRNYNGTEVFVFYVWDDESSTLSTILNKDNDINVLSENFKGGDLFPIAITKENKDIFLLLYDQSHFKLRQINPEDTSAQPYEFNISSFFTHDLYFVDMTIDNEILYLFMNEYVRAEYAEQNNIQEGDSGGYMISYNLNTQKLDFEKLSDTRIDFVSRDDENFVYGLYDKDVLEISKYNLETHSKTLHNINLPPNNIIITPNTSFYKDGKLFLNFDKINSNTIWSENYFIIADIDRELLAHDFLYKSDGSISVKYYQSNSNYQYNEPYSTAT